MANEKKALLAFGEEALTGVVSKTLRGKGFQVKVLKDKNLYRLPKERFDHLIQLGCDPQPLTEGTRLLLKKAQKDKSNFLLVSSLRSLSKPPTTCDKTCIESLHFAEALTQQFRQKQGVDTAILRLPILYGPGVPFRDSGPLGELLSEFAADQTANFTLTVYGEGKDSNYYLFLTDAAEAVSTALTAKKGIKTSDTKEGIYNALPSAPISSISIAETLNGMGGNRHEIHYHRGLTPIEEEIKPEGAALPRFKPKTSLEEGMLETLKERAEERDKSGKKQAKRQKITYPINQPAMKKERKLTKGKLIAAGIILLLILPALYIGGRVLLAGYNLVQMRQQLNAFDLQAAKQSADTANAHFAAVERSLGTILLTKESSGGPLHSLALISQAGTELTTAIGRITEEGETALTLIENLLRSRQGEMTNKQTEEEFDRLAAALGEAKKHLLTGQLRLTQVEGVLRRWVSPYIDLLQEAIEAAELGEDLASVAFDLLGYRGDRNYLILLQNAAEARAGGGFLGSLAQLTLKNGGIKKMEVFDSYQFDTVGAVAPTIIKNLLDVEILRLRENNFYASFPESGRNISQLYEEAQGIEIDGIIGLNLLLAKEIVTISGPLELSGFERTITADNLFEITTEEVEKEFFPGTTKKRRFLQALGEELINSLFALNRGSYTALANTVWRGLERKDVLLFFEEGTLTQALIESGFDGRTKNTDGDFLMVIDSNYGTKANVWVERSVDYEVFTANRAEQLQGELTITWNHAGTAAWPSGTYTNLLRVLVPKGSGLTGATLNGEEYLSKMILAEEAGKAEFATLLKIEPQTTAVLKLSYSLPLTLDTDESYSLWVQKQPGTIGDKFAFAFEEPFGRSVSGEGLQRKGNDLTFEDQLDRDIGIKIEIEEQR
jgi:hypothetical protein